MIVIIRMGRLHDMFDVFERRLIQSSCYSLRSADEDSIGAVYLVVVLATSLATLLGQHRDRDELGTTRGTGWQR
jgi:hypothetical protein